jgi:hypothetical protein
VLAAATARVHGRGGVLLLGDGQHRIAEACTGRISAHVLWGKGVGFVCVWGGGGAAASIVTVHCRGDVLSRLSAALQHCTTERGSANKNAVLWA